ncbi:hypothetical protein DERP_001862 [Dermatophagoides pteronyssinus]|uniref:Uncharacterized protein n=1 Tax=Dermatophagoides pteronyssinus TaxID=6956 RepID=A0ABQ8JBV1_DERPT|nr:hypothetical protein DERP_001862 [Dermatophagoides pteronyssinus]
MNIINGTIIIFSIIFLQHNLYVAIYHRCHRFLRDNSNINQFFYIMDFQLHVNFILKDKN